MPISEGLRVSLNQLRETSIQNNTLYHREVPEILPTTSIGEFGQPLLDNPNLMNEFMSMLVQRIVYTAIITRRFNNPLKKLEGDRIPLGSVGQEIYINPTKGRQFNVDDFAGLLAKYEADVKVEYSRVNSDLQYPVTISRAKLKNAFVSWGNLEDFIMGIINSLYNGAYIDEYKLTKGLVTTAYASNQVQVQTINAIDSEETAKKFMTLARSMFLAMQLPSFKFNAWRQVGGYGRDVITWSNPEDIVFLLRGDVASYLDVNVLANAFNIDKTTLLGNIIYVDDFNLYDENGNVSVDGSSIIGIMADKSWFRIKEQDLEMDEFYNANNRTWQYYLNIVKMYSYSLFSNAIVFATSEPSVTITSLDFKAPDGVTVVNGEKEGLDITVNPHGANTPIITYETSDEAVFTVEADPNDNRHSIVTATGSGTATLTAKAGNVQATVTITVTEN